jgi:hypothetical protein
MGRAIVVGGGVRLEDAQLAMTAPIRRRWWERVAQAFVVETELADGSRVAMPVDPSGMLTFWPMSPDLVIAATHVVGRPAEPLHP